MSISSDQLFQQNPSIITSEIDNEMVMMDSNFESYFGLHTIGTEVWNLLEQPNSIQRIAESLVERYDVTLEQCIEDLTPLMQDLINNGMIAAV